MTKKSGNPLEWEILRTFVDPGSINAPRTPGAENILSILAIQAMIAVESAQRYGGITQRRYEVNGKPGRRHPDPVYWQ